MTFRKFIIDPAKAHDSHAQNCTATDTPNTHTRVQCRGTCVFLETSEGQNKENVLEGGASLRNTEVSLQSVLLPGSVLTKDPI